MNVKIVYKDDGVHKAVSGFMESEDELFFRLIAVGTKTKFLIGKSSVVSVKELHGDE